MRGLLASEGRHPLAFGEPGFVDADLVGECSLERALPVVLEFLQPVLGAAAGIAHPAEVLCKEGADAINNMVIETVDHALDDGAGLLRLGAVVVLGQHGLFWA